MQFFSNFVENIVYADYAILVIQPPHNLTIASTKLSGVGGEGVGVFWFHLVRSFVCPSADRIAAALYPPEY